MGDRFGSYGLKSELLDVRTDDSSHLHHIDGLAFLKVAEVRYFAGLAGGIGILEDGKQFCIRDDEFTGVFGFSVFGLRLKTLAFDIVPELFGDLCAGKCGGSEEGGQFGFELDGFAESFGFFCHDVFYFGLV